MRVDLVERQLMGFEAHQREEATQKAYALMGAQFDKYQLVWEKTDYFGFQWKLSRD